MQASNRLLVDARDDGHVCLPVAELIKLAEEALEAPPEIDRSAIACTCCRKGRIEVGEMFHDGKLENFIWLRPLFLSEVGICRQLMRLRQAPCSLRPFDVDRALEWVQQKLGIKLAANQQQAVPQAMKEKVQIITGGPGTGKSTITKAILAITEKLSDKIILAAPTGRAAKRMTEITGKKARTIHSLLEFDFKAGGFKRGAGQSFGLRSHHHR